VTAKTLGKCDQFGKTPHALLPWVAGKIPTSAYFSDAIETILDYRSLLQHPLETGSIAVSHSFGDPHSHERVSTTENYQRLDQLLWEF